MSVKVTLEIGHVAALKPKPSPEGFTHDWELYVRGIDSTDCSNYIEKVVFTLHESFPKPKRVVKDPPYILKESGYAGFNLPIDIYFKCRDDTKKVTYNYDLSLNVSSNLTNKDTKTVSFTNPTDDFRRKLLKGGGFVVADRISNVDEKSRESLDDRPQLISKPKLGGGNDSSSTKKYKMKTEDPKVSFEQLFGSSKSNKVSPDPKSKASPSFSSRHQPQKSSSGGQKSEKSSRDRSEKEKKDKNKHTSPSKEAKASSVGKEAAKKVDEKHERREEQKKEKLHSKERDRSKDKPPKQRPPSPKAKSPKRGPSPAVAKISPPSSSVKEDTVAKTSSAKSVEHAHTVAERPSSSAKKSKKDKKDKGHHDKERDRKDKEHKSKEERPSSKISEKITTKKDGSSTPKDVVKEKIRNVESKTVAANVVPEPPSAEAASQPKIITASDKKVEKDPDRKHKHKKKDKNKDKEPSSKDRKKDKPSKSKDEPVVVAAPIVAASPVKRQTPVETAAVVAPQPPSQQQTAKPNPIVSTLPNENKVSSDSDDDKQPSTAKAATIDSTAAAVNTNSSHPEQLVAVRHIDEKLSASGPPPDKPTKRGRKDTKATEKEDKKRKRKSKDEPELTKRKTPSPAVIDQEPPSKLPKKDDTRPAVQALPQRPLSRNDISSSISTTNLLTPIGAQLDHRLSPATVSHPPKTSPAPSLGTTNTTISTSVRPTPPPHQLTATTTTTSSTLTTNVSANIASATTVSTTSVSTIALDYMSELKNLQHKIMTLQDNQELQQVVEMIAETGCYEITSKTFDFDLCALDRSTVQRLLDFFAASCS